MLKSTLSEQRAQTRLQALSRGTSARPSERFFRLAGLPRGRPSDFSVSRDFREAARRIFHARGTSAKPSERFFSLAGLPQGRQSRPSRSRSLRKRRRRRARVFVLRHNLHIRFGFIHYSFPALTKCRDALCGGVLTVQYYQLFHQRKARTSSWLDLSEPVVK